MKFAISRNRMFCFFSERRLYNIHEGLKTVEYKRFYRKEEKNCHITHLTYLALMAHLVLYLFQCH